MNEFTKKNLDRDRNFKLAAEFIIEELLENEEL